MCAAIYGSVVRRGRRVLGLSGIPPFGGSLNHTYAPYGYLAVNETKSGDAFRQECGLKVTINGKSEYAPLRLPGP